MNGYGVVLFLHLAAIARAFFHRTRLPRVLDLAAFEIGRRLAETALLRVLVDLRATRRIAAAHDIDRRLLAAHQLADDLVDQPFLEQRGKPFGYFHADAGYAPDCPKRPTRRCVNGQARTHPGAGLRFSYWRMLT